jgi:hypothetical protein
VILFADQVHRNTKRSLMSVDPLSWICETAEKAAENLNAYKSYYKCKMNSIQVSEYLFFELALSHTL